MKNKKWILLYGILFFPFVLTILFSVPSADDFSIANRVLEFSNTFSGAYHHTVEFYNDWAGDFVTTFIQLLFNPLLYFPIDSFGVGIILVFSFTVFAIVMTIYFRMLMKYVVGITSSDMKWLVIFLFFIIFLNSGFYQEIFYWYDGCAYLWGYIFTIINQILIIIFFRENKGGIFGSVLCIIGFLACVGYQQAVFAGVVYLVEFFNHDKKISDKIAKIIPLMFMIAGGCISVFAPGNFSRHDAIDSSGIYVKAAIIASFQNTISCTLALITSPLFIAVIVILFIIGFSYIKGDVINPLILCGMQIMSVFGVAFPVALGYSNGYLPNRMEFIVNLTNCIFIVSISLALGAWIKMKADSQVVKKITELKSNIIVLAIIFLLLSEMQIGQDGVTMLQKTPWMKTIASIERVAYESDYYKDLLVNVKQSDQMNVELKDYPESKKSGIIKVLELTDDPDDWRNKGVAKYLKKETVIIRKE